MHPYLPHLLSDILSAHREKTHGEIIPTTNYIEELKEIDQWLNSEEPEETLGYYCGLQPEDFPPPEQLEDDDIKIVRQAFDEMLLSWNHRIEYLEDLPERFAYKIMVSTLTEQTTIMNHGTTTFDFCTGYAPDCKLKEYCPCLEVWNEFKDMDDTDTEPSNNDEEDFKNDEANEIPF